MKKYILIGLGVVLVALMLIGDGLGIAAWLKIGPMGAKTAEAAPPKPAGKAAATPAKPAGPTVGKALFVEIPQFVVTLPTAPASGGTDTLADSGDGSSRYLQLSLSFLTEDKEAAADFAKLAPIVKAGVITDIMALGADPKLGATAMKRTDRDR